LQSQHVRTVEWHDNVLEHFTPITRPTTSPDF
jgi:hypothetical protein